MIFTKLFQRILITGMYDSYQFISFFWIFKSRCNELFGNQLCLTDLLTHTMSLAKKNLVFDKSCLR